jgi:hypothetical protein
MDTGRRKFYNLIGGNKTGQSQQGKSSHLEPPETHRELSCLAEGDPAVFLVPARNGSSLLHLKKFVWEERKNNLFRYVDAADLILYKVRR